jgi:uncharacterized membrane protein
LDDQSFPSDFVCAGNNPDWRLRILTGDEAILEIANKPPLVFPYRSPQKIDAGPECGESWIYVLRADPGEITVTIAKQPGRDKLSGVNYQYKAKVSADGQAYEGYAFRPGTRPENPDVLRAAS